MIVDLQDFITAHNGQVLNITPSDAPEKKDDLVAGHYEVPSSAPTCLAIKIIDILGEEVIHMAQV
jgi:hypothetical protein